MAWEWVAPGATAFVGVLSVTATWSTAIYNSRRSRQATTEDLERRARLEADGTSRRERQRLYGVFLVAEQELFSSVHMQAESPLILEKRMAMSGLAYQIEISAPQEVADRLRLMHALLLKLGSFDTIPELAMDLHLARGSLILAMRADLSAPFA